MRDSLGSAFTYSMRRLLDTLLLLAATACAHTSVVTQELRPSWGSVIINRSHDTTTAQGDSVVLDLVLEGDDGERPRDGQVWAVRIDLMGKELGRSYPPIGVYRVGPVPPGYYHVFARAIGYGGADFFLTAFEGERLRVLIIMRCEHPRCP